MKQILSKINVSRLLLAMSLIVLSFIVNSCADNFYELNKPSWLGESIYEQLNQGYNQEDAVTKVVTNHTFKNYIRLIDDIGYADVLKKTGSKTLFVANDNAFDRFFQSNPWGVQSYEGLTLAQKKMIINSSMINNAYLVELLSSTEGPIEGQALRRKTAIEATDTIGFEKGEDLPQNNKNWDYYRTKGLLLLKDNTAIPMTHFLQKQMDYNGISNTDFATLFGVPREKNDAHVFGNKIIARDITCKNGYIDVLQDVFIPPTNMAELIRVSPETKLFSRMMDRFSAPYFDQSATDAYALSHPGATDSVFVKKYFATQSAGGANLSNPRKENQGKAVLDYDPGWNVYAPSQTSGTGANNKDMQIDMGSVFAPTDDIMNVFFTTGAGKFLTEKYGSIDNIPSENLALLIKNMMKPSFLSSVPSKFAEVLDDGKEPMGVKSEDVVKTYMGNNGAVYVTNKIFAPASYVAVTAPTLVNDYMKIFNWAVTTLKFDAYLLSMDSRYSFIVPSDATLGVKDTPIPGMFWIDPLSLGAVKPLVYKFWFYNGKTDKSVKATCYAYDPATGLAGDSVRAATATEVLDRLEDMLDYHIVVGDIEDGKQFYRTKGGGQLQVSGTGIGMQIAGGGNVGTPSPKVTKIYDQTAETNSGRGNGKTYLTDSPLLPPYKSVYKVLSGNSEFSEFFKLLDGYPNGRLTAAELLKLQIFSKEKNYASLDLNVQSFNTFHYTVYAPTNAAVLAAYSQGLPSWDQIKALNDSRPPADTKDPLLIAKDKKIKAVVDSLSNELVNILRYHFQDNALYIDGKSNIATYETAAFSTVGVKSYYKIYTDLKSTGLTLYTDKNDVSTAVNVEKANGLYNIMTRDYKFNKGDIKLADQIETSSFAVVHQVNKLLFYDPSQLARLKRLTQSGQQLVGRKKSTNNLRSAK